MKNNLSPRAFVAPFALLMVANLISHADAQPVPRRPILVPGRLDTMKLVRVVPRISPQLRTYLIAQKPVISEAVLEKSFALRNGVTFFKLADGTERPLMEPMEVTEQASPPVPAELSAAKSYIFAQTNFTTTRLSELKFGNRFVLSLIRDHRASMSPIRDQGGRGTCTAFAFCGAFEAFPNVGDLSEQYLFHEGQRKAGQPFSTTKGLLPKWAAEVGTEGIPTEDKMPYTASYPPANETIPQAAISAAKYKVTEWEFIPNAGLSGVSIRNTNYLETLINQGYNIPFWTQIAWSNSQTAGVIDVVMVGSGATKTPASSRGDHEMVIVGYDAKAKYFIVRNSWGTGFGHSGYAYISYDYIRTYAVEGLYIKKVSTPLRTIGPIFRDPNFKVPIRRLP